MKEIKSLKNWKKETARDMLAFGSWIFYILVIARALIKPYRPFADQIIIAGIILLFLSLFIKDSDSYIARGLILAVFTSLFYQDNLFTAFAVLALMGLAISSYLAGNSKIKIIRGLIVGVTSTLIAYYLAGFSFVATA